MTVIFDGPGIYFSDEQLVTRATVWMCCRLHPWHGGSRSQRWPPPFPPEHHVITSLPISYLALLHISHARPFFISCFLLFISRHPFCMSRHPFCMSRHPFFLCLAIQFLCHAMRCFCHAIHFFCITSFVFMSRHLLFTSLHSFSPLQYIPYQDSLNDLSHC